MQFKNFSEFYIHYLSAHQNRQCRRFHFIGTSAVISLILLFFFTGNTSLFLFMPLAGYGFAWAGHFFYEKNLPLTFKYPIYSLAGDFKMFWEILIGKLQAF
jgi:hypothetical protein